MIIFALKMLAAWFLLSVAFVAFVWQPMLGRWYRGGR
jgi:hypothetical protein